MEPIVQHSKCQATIESSKFGSKVISLMNAIDIVKGIRYNLHTMGMPINVPDYMFGENMNVVNGAFIT